MQIDHRPLHRVHFTPGAGNAFDGANRLAMQLRQKQNAGIERPRPGVIRDHDAACATIAFVTTFLGAGKASGFAKPFQ